MNKTSKKVINTLYTNGQKSLIMSSASTSESLQIAIENIGYEIGKQILEDHFIKNSTIQTPMNFEIERPLPDIPLCAIITTKDDFNHLGKGISSVLNNSINGFMDFEGKRGIQALNAEINHLVLPDTKAKVNTLILAKAVLATGCTAVHLAKTAINKYLPRRIIIAAIFYTKNGLLELEQEVPNADIVVIGEPDSLNEDGMLIPGVGNLDQRLKT